MNYKWHYDNLIKTRRERVPIQGAYYEKHHIVMKSMGGNNSKENLILLTPREHFLAHWLLWRIHRNRSTAYAFFGMCSRGKKVIKNSRAFEEARNVFSNERRGKKMSDEQKKKLSEKNKGKKHSQATKEKISISRKDYVNNGGIGNLGKKHSIETKEKISKAHKGFHTEETKNKISSSHKGLKHSMETKNKISESKKGCIPWNKRS